MRRRELVAWLAFVAALAAAAVCVAEVAQRQAPVIKRVQRPHTLPARPGVAVILESFQSVIPRQQQTVKAKDGSYRTCFDYGDAAYDLVLCYRNVSPPHAVGVPVDVA